MCVQVSVFEVCERPGVSELLPDRQTDEETQDSPSSARVLHTGNSGQIKTGRCCVLEVWVFEPESFRVEFRFYSFHRK